MNFWGFDCDFIDRLEERFPAFFRHVLPTNTERAEFSLPIEIADMIDKGECSVKVIETKDRWHGVTSRADHKGVVEAFCQLLERGEYPKEF
jgi:hypothetical protein